MSFVLIALCMILIVALSVLLRRGVAVSLLSLGVTFGGCMVVALSLAQSNAPRGGASLDGLGILLLGGEAFLGIAASAAFLAALCYWAACSAPEKTL